eukprot:TRINITY_DN41211_c0_g2_i1.p1 TRINITY_DN41211_c0_g2~~TRINITY_DN41211_c0_g2_i1.p1  ORF type:complete len:244 (+),score=66.24 TRINITY_DN41211_c0_g2_i1:147-878(+)
MSAVDEAMGVLAQKRSGADAEVAVSVAEPLSKAAKTPKGKAGAKSGASGSRDANVQDLVTAIGRLVISNSKDISTLKSVHMTNLLFDKELGKQWVDGWKAIGASYFDQTQKMSPSQKAQWCAPHVFIWLDVHREMKELQVVKDHTALLEKERDDFLRDTETDMEKNAVFRLLIERHVKVLKIVKTWNPAQMRMETCAVSHAAPVLEVFLRKVCKATKGKIKYNAAPQGQLERRIAKQVFDQQA